MSARSGILGGGNWIVDKLKFIDVYPRQEALGNIIGETIGNGGSPFNVLTDLARLGADFPLEGIGLTGADADGEWIRERCAEYGIGAEQIHTHPTASTAYTDVMTVKSTGKRTFFHQRGANAFLDDEHFDFTGVSSKIFHLGYLVLLDRLDRPDAEYGTVAGRVLQRAKEAGCRTSVDVVSEDAHRFQALVPPVMPYVDYCVVNEFEAERITGIETRPGGEIDLKAVERAARQLMNMGVNEWAIIHFPEGACALGRDGVAITQGSLRVPQAEIVSTVGAGDAFVAGVLYGLHEEERMEKALLYGVTAAASCLYGPGTSDGVKPLAECLELERRFGARALAGGIFE